MHFPLPQDQLPRVRINQQTVAEWKAEAHDAIHSLMMDKSSWFYRFDQADPGFTRVYDKNGTRGCMRVMPGTNTVEYLSQGELLMPLEDVVYSMYCETTQQQRAVHAQLYEHICLDSAILELYELASAKDPFHRVAFLWTALCPKLTNTPMRWSLSSARDYLYFDFSCTTKDAEGRTVLINYRKSHDIQQDELVQDHSLGISRRYTHGITTYCRHDSQHVVMTALGHIALESKRSSVALKVILPIMYNRELNHTGLVAARNLQSIGITADTLAERNTAPASMCRVCHMGFNVIRKRKWCRGCGHAIFRDCTMEIALLQSGVLLRPCLPVVKARFCLRCLIHASEQRIKNELEHKRMMAAKLLQECWWGGANLSVDGFLELHRELRDDDDLTILSADATSSFSTTDSELKDEKDRKVHEATTVAAGQMAHLRLGKKLAPSLS